MKKEWKVVFQITATYVGTVVGAGFATGQEILQFFTRHYHWGFFGILISTLLFISLGSKMMLLSNRIGSYSYQEFNTHLFGPFLGFFVNLFVFIVLFGVTSVMLSGTGAIFEEQLGLSYQLGIMVTILLSYLVIKRGLDGLFLVNSLVVPIMLIFSLYILIKVGWHEGGLTSITGFTSWKESWTGWNWLVSGFTYVAFNLAMAQAVLVPMGKEIKHQRALYWGGVAGGIVLGFMLVASHLALHTLMPEALEMDVPMAFVIKEIGVVILALFLLVVYGEVFTTLIGNIFGLARQIVNTFQLPENWTIIMLLLTSFVISQAGFTSLVSHLYPFFGYLGLVLLLFLAYKKIPA